MHVQGQFRRSVLSKSNWQNLNLIKEKVSHVDEIHRLQKIEKGKRWERFREIRQLVVDEYLMRKRIQRMAEEIVRIHTVHQIVYKVKANIEKVEFQREAELKSAFMAIKISQLWRRRCKRWGQTPLVMRKNKLRHLITFDSAMMKDTGERRALLALKAFWAENL